MLSHVGAAWRKADAMASSFKENASQPCARHRWSLFVYSSQSPTEVRMGSFGVVLMFSRGYPLMLVSVN